MKELFKKVGVGLYERVWLSWKSTLLGIGFAVLAVTLESVQTFLTGNEAVWAKIVLSLVALALVFVRGRAVSQPLPPSAGNL